MKLSLNFLTLGVMGDIYLHYPRGSNNRLNEETNTRANGNRLLILRTTTTAATTLLKSTIKKVVLSPASTNRSISPQAKAPLVKVSNV